MSKNPMNTQTTAAAKAPVKKRTIYSVRSMLELPEWAKKDTAHKYRWVSKRRTARSDGFDARGWSIARNPENNESLESHDLVLHKMPVDVYEAMQEYKQNLTRQNVEHVLESIASTQERLRYEVERSGGKLPTTEFSIERKQS